MKKQQPKKLQFTKKIISKMNTSISEILKGGTDPISDLFSADASHCGNEMCR